MVIFILVCNTFIRNLKRKVIYGVTQLMILQYYLYDKVEKHAEHDFYKSFHLLYYQGSQKAPVFFFNMLCPCLCFYLFLLLHLHVSVHVNFTPWIISWYCISLSMGLMYVSAVLLCDSYCMCVLGSTGQEGHEKHAGSGFWKSYSIV